MLYSFDEAARQLGGISQWTLYKHASRGHIRVVHIGRRVFLDAAELERIQKNGLPSLAQPHLVHPILETGAEND